MRSKRAALIAEVLRYINSNDYEMIEGRFLVFGASAFWAYVAGDAEDHSELDQALLTVQDELLKIHGERALLERVSMRQVSPNAEREAGMKFINALPEDERERLMSMEIEESSTQIPPAATDDSIDAALANQFVKDLDAAYSRTVELGAHEIDAITYNTNACLEEAHYCDMRGQKIAAAVLCRAIVEDALKKATDPDGKLRLQLIGTDESYFESLLKKASDKGLLDDSRIAGARLIRNAGNKAAHDLSTFRSKYSARVGEIVDIMRAILEDLSKHASPSNASH